LSWRESSASRPKTWNAVRAVNDKRPFGSSDCPPLHPAAAEPYSHFPLIWVVSTDGRPAMAADEDDCVSYACECVRLAGLTDDEPVTRRFVTAEEPPLYERNIFDK
jgi:hypothetical protein